MKEFFHKHRLLIILTGGAIVLYLIYRWYVSNQDANAAQNAQNAASAADTAYLSGLVYGQPTDLGSGGGAATPAGSGGSTGGVNPTAPLGSSTPTTPAGSTATGPSSNVPSSPAGGNVPLGANIPSGSNVPVVSLGSTPTQAQISAIGGHLAFSPLNTAAQDFAAEGYTGVPSQDAATARMLQGVGSPVETALFAGNPQELAGSGPGAPPEIVAACSADIASGRQCFSPGSTSDALAFQFGLPTSGNYELGPNGSVIQLSPGVTPIGMTPEQLANESIYHAPNGVTFINGVAQVGATLPSSQGGSAGQQFVGPSTPGANQGGSGGSQFVTAPPPSSGGNQINPTEPVQGGPTGTLPPGFHTSPAPIVPPIDTGGSSVFGPGSFPPVHGGPVQGPPLPPGSFPPGFFGEPGTPGSGAPIQNLPGGISQGPAAPVIPISSPYISLVSRGLGILNPRIAA